MKKILDLALQFFFVSGFLYAGFQLFFVFKNPEGGMVLWGAAASIDPEIVVIRRLYALEFWLIFIGYIVYLALREKLFGEEYRLLGES